MGNVPSKPASSSSTVSSGDKRQRSTINAEATGIQAHCVADEVERETGVAAESCEAPSVVEEHAVGPNEEPFTSKDCDNQYVQHRGAIPRPMVRQASQNREEKPDLRGSQRTDLNNGDGDRSHQAGMNCTPDDKFAAEAEKNIHCGSVNSEQSGIGRYTSDAVNQSAGTISGELTSDTRESPQHPTNLATTKAPEPPSAQTAKQELGTALERPSEPTNKAAPACTPAFEPPKLPNGKAVLDLTPSCTLNQTTQDTTEGPSSTDMVSSKSHVEGMACHISLNTECAEMRVPFDPENPTVPETSDLRQKAAAVSLPHSVTSLAPDNMVTTNSSSQSSSFADRHQLHRQRSSVEAFLSPNYRLEDWHVEADAFRMPDYLEHVCVQDLRFELVAEQPRPKRSTRNSSKKREIAQKVTVPSNQECPSVMRPRAGSSHRSSSNSQPVSGRGPRRTPPCSTLKEFPEQPSLQEQQTAKPSGAFFRVWSAVSKVFRRPSVVQQETPRKYAEFPVRDLSRLSLNGGRQGSEDTRHTARIEVQSLNTEIERECASGSRPLPKSRSLLQRLLSGKEVSQDSKLSFSTRGDGYPPKEENVPLINRGTSEMHNVPSDYEETMQTSSSERTLLQPHHNDMIREHFLLAPESRLETPQSGHSVPGIIQASGRGVSKGEQAPKPTLSHPSSSRRQALSLASTTQSVEHHASAVGSGLLPSTSRGHGQDTQLHTGFQSMLRQYLPRELLEDTATSALSKPQDPLHEQPSGTERYGSQFDQAESQRLSEITQAAQSRCIAESSLPWRAFVPGRKVPWQKSSHRAEATANPPSTATLAAEQRRNFEVQLLAAQLSKELSSQTPSHGLQQGADVMVGEQAETSHTFPETVSRPEPLFPAPGLAIEDDYDFIPEFEIPPLEPLHLPDAADTEQMHVDLGQPRGSTPTNLSPPIPQAQPLHSSHYASVRPWGEESLFPPPAVPTPGQATFASTGPLTHKHQLQHGFELAPHHEQGHFAFPQIRMLLHSKQSPKKGPRRAHKTSAGSSGQTNPQERQQILEALRAKVQAHQRWNSYLESLSAASSTLPPTHGAQTTFTADDVGRSTRRHSSHEPVASQSHEHDSQFGDLQTASAQSPSDPHMFKVEPSELVKPSDEATIDYKRWNSYLESLRAAIPTRRPTHGSRTTFMADDVGGSTRRHSSYEPAASQSHVHDSLLGDLRTASGQYPSDPHILEVQPSESVKASDEATFTVPGLLSFPMGFSHEQPGLSGPDVGTRKPASKQLDRAPNVEGPQFPPTDVNLPSSSRSSTPRKRKPPPPSACGDSGESLESPEKKFQQSPRQASSSESHSLRPALSPTKRRSGSAKRLFETAEKEGAESPGTSAGAAIEAPDEQRVEYQFGGSSGSLSMSLEDLYFPERPEPPSVFYFRDTPADDPLSELRRFSEDFWQSD